MFASFTEDQSWTAPNSPARDRCSLPAAPELFIAELDAALIALGHSAVMSEAGSGAPLSIYWIDVEGGASTILAAPNGQTIVVDAGFPGARDAGRVAK